MEFEKYVRCGEDEEEIVTYEVEEDDLKSMFINYIKRGKIKVEEFVQFVFDCCELDRNNLQDYFGNEIEEFANNKDTQSLEELEREEYYNANRGI